MRIRLFAAKGFVNVITKLYAAVLATVYVLGVMLMLCKVFDCIAKLKLCEAYSKLFLFNVNERDFEPLLINGLTNIPWRIWIVVDVGIVDMLEGKTSVSEPVLLASTVRTIALKRT